MYVIEILTSCQTWPLTSNYKCHQFLRNLIPPLESYKFWSQNYQLTWASFSGFSPWRPQKTFFVFVLRPTGCLAAQPWLIQAGLGGEQPGQVTQPGIWCLAAMKKLALWQSQPQSSAWLELRLKLATFHTCSWNRTIYMIDFSNLKNEIF